MRKLLLTVHANAMKMPFILTCIALCLLTVSVLSFNYKDAWYPHTKALTLSCSAKVDFEIRSAGASTRLDGRLGMVTLGKDRMALTYNGQLITPEGRYTLDRTLLMNAFYYAKNNALELILLRDMAQETDNVPDDLFLRLIKDKHVILRLARFNDNAWLVSGVTMPLYICNDNQTTR